MLTEDVKFLDNVLINTKMIGDVYGEVTGFGKTFLAIKVDDYTVINIQHRDINKIVNFTRNKCINKEQLNLK